jgi:hypothetical protein
MTPIEMQDRMIDLQNRLRYAESQAAEWKEDSLKWRELYRKAVSHDGRIIQHLKEASDE